MTHSLDVPAPRPSSGRASLAPDTDLCADRLAQGRRLRRLARSLAAAVDRERFAPSLLGAFVNPNFPTRRRIAAFVRRQAHLLTGEVLDFGGGEMPYRRFAHARSWRNVEYAPSLDGADLLEIARRNRAAHEHILYDGRRLPLPDGCIDTVLATEVFEHLFNLEEILAEIHRVLRPGGALVATTPFAMYEHEIPHDFARYTSFALRDRLRRAGFRVERIEKLSGPLAVWLQMATWLWWEPARRGRRLAWLGAPTLPIVNVLCWLLERKETSSARYFLNIGCVAFKSAQ